MIFAKLRPTSKHHEVRTQLCHYVMSIIEVFTGRAHKIETLKKRAGFPVRVPTPRTIYHAVPVKLPSSRAQLHRDYTI